jgi:hypothetical protein
VIIVAAPVGQSNWRFCNKCHVLFFNGYPEAGRCVVGGQHVATALNGKAGSWDYILITEPVSYPGPE